MRHPSGQRNSVIGGHDAALIANPHLQRAVEDDDDFIGGVVEMRRCAGARFDDAKARRASDALLRAGERKAAITRAPRDLGRR
jgi:hypothetical protein